MSKLNIAVISDITFDLVLNQLNERDDYSIEKYVYSDSIVTEILKAGSWLKGVDILIVHFDSYFYRYTDEYIGQLLDAVVSLASDFPGNILLSNNMVNGRHTSIMKENIGQDDQVILEMESSIRAILDSNNVFFYDVKKIISRIGLVQSYNFKLGFLYQMPYTKNFITRLVTKLRASIRFLTHPEKKAIFVDCDNTLWRGILGEDGLDGIQCNKNAKGILFYHFQEFLLEKKNEGFILGLCSKNNEADVKQAFESLNMPLKWNDFVIKKVNWQVKAENLKAAAAELNIGMDSFIFIDDSEFEIQSMKSISPEVFSLLFTDDYDDFLQVCDDYCFKRKRLTTEDMEKSRQYAQEQQRNKVRSSVQSFEQYVESLEIRMDISENNVNDLARLAQLTEKTNQFNFNKEIFSVAQVAKFMEEGNLVFGLRVSDKFGDYGLVGLILIEVSERKGVMRNFLMSCRALGRLIENDFYNYVLNSLSEKGIELTKIVFRETAKNIPARNFYEGLESGSKKKLSA